MKFRSLSHIVGDTYDRLEDRVRESGRDLQVMEVGRVIRVGEGIAIVEGLPGVGSEELVYFPDNIRGLAYNLDPDQVGVILLDHGDSIAAGDEVRRSGRVLDLPVGDRLPGRVIDPLGRSLDDLGPLPFVTRYPIERPAPPIMHRAPVETPLQTGIKTIDALIPIGRGQRELILGDRQTGKTTIALDTIINQKEEGVICVYCAIGKQKAEVASVVKTLRDNGALDYTVVISATGGEPAGMQYAAPYAATSVGEYFMEQGNDVLIVYDDLTWHARAYRELALLLRRPPGREAYPGDIFYLHARLLERATHLKEQFGGGSMTAFPIIETEGQNISEFIPTNLISITDGQIYLSPDLLQKDFLPAIDVGLSVSRVGGAAQLPYYRFLSKNLKLAYSQYQELETFSRFGAKLDEATRETVEHGRRIREILKQPPLAPLSVPEQILQMVAVTEGKLEDLPVSQLKEVKVRLRTAARNQLSDIGDKIKKGDHLVESERNAVTDLIDEVIGEFRSGAEVTNTENKYEPK